MTGGASVTYGSNVSEKGGIVHITSTGKLTTDDPTELEGDAQLIVYGELDAGSNNKNVILRNNGNELYVMGTLSVHELLMESSEDSLFIFGGSSVTVNEKFKMQNTARLCMESAASLATKDLINDATNPVIVASGGESCISFTNSGTVNQDFTADPSVNVCQGASATCSSCNWGSANVQTNCGSCGALLPVELIEWNAGVWNDGVLLRWVTLSETNNDYFKVERSLNGLDFEPVGSVLGAGTTGSVQHYQLVDPEGSSDYYYRLTQYDFDGKSQVFQLVRANATNHHKGKVNLPIASWPLDLTRFQGQAVAVQVRSVTGQLLQEYRLAPHADLFLTPQDLNLPYSNGIYHVVLRDEQHGLIGALPVAVVQ